MWIKWCLKTDNVAESFELKEQIKTERDEENAVFSKDLRRAKADMQWKVGEMNEHYV